MYWLLTENYVLNANILVFMLIHTELLSNVSGLGLKKIFGPRPRPWPLVQIQTMCQTVLMRLPPITPLMTTYQRWPNLSPLSMGDRLSILVHLKLLNQLEAPMLGQVVRCKMSRSQNCLLNNCNVLKAKTVSVSPSVKNIEACCILFPHGSLSHC